MSFLRRAEETSLPEDQAGSIAELQVGQSGRVILSGHPASLPDRTPEQAVRLYASLGARTLLTLLTHKELQDLGLQHLPQLCSASGLEWLHAPIADRQAPAPAFDDWWSISGPRLHQTLDEGAVVAVHCWGGKGRTGTIAARLLIERGLTAEAAIAAVRQRRHGAIETAVQVEYLLRLTSTGRA